MCGDCPQRAAHSDRRRHRETILPLLVSVTMIRFPSTTTRAEAAALLHDLTPGPAGCPSFTLTATTRSTEPLGGGQGGRGGRDGPSAEPPLHGRAPRSDLAAAHWFLRAECVPKTDREHGMGQAQVAHTPHPRPLRRLPARPRQGRAQGGQIPPRRRGGSRPGPGVTSHSAATSTKLQTFKTRGRRRTRWARPNQTPHVWLDDGVAISTDTHFTDISL